MIQQNNHCVKLSERDWKWMALGEIGAYLAAILSAVFVAMSLDESATFVRIFAGLASLYFVAKAALGFVHLGYRPESNSSKN